MKQLKYIIFTLLLLIMTNCKVKQNAAQFEVFETASNGNSLQKVTKFLEVNNPIEVTLNEEEKFQTITGFGGAFTESSAYLLSKLGKENQKKIMEAYFSEKGANYSLTRTHINSCDFSLTRASTASAVPSGEESST